MGFWEKKCKKPPFLGILGKKGKFWTVFGQNGQKINLPMTTTNFYVQEYRDII